MQTPVSPWGRWYCIKTKEGRHTISERMSFGACMGVLPPYDTLHPYPSTCVIERSIGLVMLSGFVVLHAASPRATSLSSFQASVEVFPLSLGIVAEDSALLSVFEDEALEYDALSKQIVLSDVGPNAVSLLLLSACKPDSQSHLQPVQGGPPYYRLHMQLDDRCISTAFHSRVKGISSLHMLKEGMAGQRF